MSLLTTAKRARGPLRLALALALALLVLILAGMLSSSSERRAHSRRRADSAGGGGGVLLKKQSNAVVRQESLLSKVPPAQKAQARARRSIVQLASMLKCVSGCNPLSYRGYGCFCGYMGDGTPVDHIDSCCLEHDWCYSQSPCSKLSLYLLPYDWHCLTPGMAHCGQTRSSLVAGARIYNLRWHGGLLSGSGTKSRLPRECELSEQKINKERSIIILQFSATTNGPKSM
ncbi:uncharacterized protein LOC144093870 isoform X2 [Amblyomma americanum]